MAEISASNAQKTAAKDGSSLGPSVGGFASGQQRRGSGICFLSSLRRLVCPYNQRPLSFTVQERGVDRGVLFVFECGRLAPSPPVRLPVGVEYLADGGRHPVFQSKASIQTNTEVLDAPLDKRVGQIPDDFDIFDQLSRVELYEAIERLPKPRERFALLGELAGKKAETIAQELGCSVAAVYNLTKKARITLKKRMKGEMK